MAGRAGAGDGEADGPKPGEVARGSGMVCTAGAAWWTGGGGGCEIVVRSRGA